MQDNPISAIYNGPKQQPQYNSQPIYLPQNIVQISTDSAINRSDILHKLVVKRCRFGFALQ